MRPDIVIRDGTVVDGTGAPAFARRCRDHRRRDHRRSSTPPTAESNRSGRREIDAEGRLVTPGFVDIHTHLDAQIAWDPIGTSSCWHGVTSVVMGNCGVTFAPCRPDGPGDAGGDDGERRGHPRRCDPRRAAVGLGDVRRVLRLDRPPAEGSEHRRAGRPLCVADLRDGRARPRRVAGDGRRRGRDGPAASTRRWRRVRSACRRAARSCTACPTADPVPGTYATADELLAFAEVLGRHGAGVFEGAMRLGERDNERFDNSRSEVASDG